MKPYRLLLQRGNHFAETSTRARATIAELGARFVRSGNVVLCHGHRCFFDWISLLHRQLCSFALGGSIPESIL